MDPLFHIKKVFSQRQTGCELFLVFFLSVQTASVWPYPSVQVRGGRSLMTSFPKTGIHRVAESIAQSSPMTHMPIYKLKAIGDAHKALFIHYFNFTTSNTAPEVTNISTFCSERLGIVFDTVIQA